MVSLETIYKWFKTKAKPTESQFRATWDSFWHKSENIPVSRIEGINEILNDQADADLLDAHIGDDDRHVTQTLREEIASKATESDLHAVALSGSYNDLIDVPVFENDGNAIKIVRTVTSTEGTAAPTLDELDGATVIGDTAEISYTDQVIEHWAFTSNDWQLKFSVDYTKKTNTSELINDGDGSSPYVTSINVSDSYVAKGNYTGDAADLKAEIDRLEAEKATLVDVEGHTYNEDLHVTQALLDEIEAKTNDAELHTVAKTGSYKDLKDLPVFEHDGNAIKIVRNFESGVQQAPTSAEVSGTPVIGDTAEVSYTNQVVEHWAFTTDGWELKFAVDFAKNKNTSQLINDGDGTSKFITTHNAADTYLPKGNYVYDASTLKNEIDEKASITQLQDHQSDDQRHVTTALRQEIASKTDDASLHAVAKSGSYKDLTDVPVFTNDGKTTFITRNYDGRTNEAYKRNAPTVSDISTPILGDTAIVSYKDAISAHWSYTDEGTWAYKFAVDEVQKTKLSDFENDGDGTSPFTTKDSVEVLLEEKSDKMPIAFKEAYINIYFVSKEQGNDSTARPNSYSFYENIVAASEAARADYDASGNKNLVYVLKGTYKEESVNREHVDMYFEDGAVVWTEGIDSSVINDKLEAINNANVYGKGTFVHKNYDPYDDREGINFRKASNLYIEAKLIDGIQHYQNDTTKIVLANISFIYGYAVWDNKELVFKNCIFLNGLQFSNHTNKDGKQVFENCEFICPPFITTDTRNKSLDILNYKNEFLFRVKFNGPNREKETSRSLLPIDTTGKTQEEVLQIYYNEHSQGRTFHAHSEISCIAYLENALSNSSDNGKIEVRNSKLVIQRSDCFGITLLARKNNAVQGGYITFENITIIDETSSGNTVAIASGWGDKATVQLDLGINGLIHNCKLDRIKVLPDLNEWEVTFKNLPKAVSVEDIYNIEDVIPKTTNELTNNGDGTSPFITDASVQSLLEDIKMPIPFKEAYVNIYFVSEDQGNDDTAKPNSYSFYENIVTASEAARADYDASGNKNLVYVFSGVYNEESVAREHVDMYFEDGAVVWVDTDSGSVINDVLEPLNNVSIYGKGTFVNTKHNPGNDGEGVNFRKASNIYLEAKLIDSIQVWDSPEASVRVVNTSMIFGFYAHGNKSLHFTNCTFLNGCKLPKYRTVNNTYIIEDCNIYLQPYPFSDDRNKTTEILDAKGEVILKIEPKSLSAENLINSLDVEGKDHEAILAEVYNVYSNENGTTTLPASVSCFTDIDSNQGWLNFGNIKLEVRNCRFIIQRENCFGIILNKRLNGISSEEGYRVFENITIIDETTGKNTVAIASGWGDQATVQPELGINGLIHNCKEDHVKVLPELNKWELTFKNLPNKVAAENITGQVSKDNLPEVPNTALTYFDDNGKTKRDLTVGVLLNSITEDFNTLTGKDVYFVRHTDEQIYEPYYHYLYDYVYIMMKKEVFDKVFVQNTYLAQSNLSSTNRPTFQKYLVTLSNKDTQYSILVTPNFGAKPNDNGYIRIISNARDNYVSAPEISDIASRVTKSIYGGEITDVDLEGCSIFAQSYDFNTSAQLNATKLSGRKATDFVQYEHIPAKTLKKGWYTIAINYGNRASAKFILRDTRSSYHQSVHFYAAHHFGNGNVITVLSNSFHANNGAIRYLRLKEGGTYDGVMLQAYIDVDDAPVQGWILEDIQSHGWSARSWIPDGTDPGGLKNYSALINIAAQVDLDHTMGVNSSQPIYSEGKKVLTLAQDNNLDITNKELRWNENSDGAAIGFENVADNQESYLYFKTLDNKTEYFKWLHQLPSSAGAEQIEWMNLKESGLKVAGDISANGAYYFGDDKQIIKFTDTWLRLNPAGHFTSGIYCGNKILRTDGEFQVGSGGNKFRVNPDGNTIVSGHLFGKAADGQYSHLYRFGGVHFTWDSDSYGTNAQHSIKSAYGTAMGDSLTMNSFNNIRLNIDSNNNNTNSKFEIGHNTSGISNVVFSVDESGNVIAAGNISGASDIKLKKDIQSVEDSFLDKIGELEAKSYRWKDETKDQSEQLGFIAQDVEKVFPEWVTETNDTKAISYDKMGAVLAVQCIKELREEIRFLKLEINNLKTIINTKP